MHTRLTANTMDEPCMYPFMKCISHSTVSTFDCVEGEI